MNLKYINPYYKNISPFSLSAYQSFQTPIYDRTEEDINLIKRLLEKGYENFTDEEKKTWLNNDLKGALNASDLNRIENNINILGNALEISLTCKTNWVSTDIPEVTDFERIQDNLEKLMEKATVYEDTPFVPDLPYNDYKKINDIEHIIFDIYDVLMSHFDVFCYADGQFCGNDIYC